MQRMTCMFGLIAGLAAGLITQASANNIRVENVEMRPFNQDTRTLEVQFDLSWDNSWRNDLNHDAAWVFIKFRAPGSNRWEHAYLATNAADHKVSGGVIEVGTSSNAVSDALGVGVFVYHNAAYTGTVNYAQTRLLWQYGTNGYNFADGEAIDVSVHAIEMVYVPEGSFFVGSGGTESSSFTDGGWDNGATINFAITSEAALNIGPNPGMLWGTGDMGDEGTLPAAFPKGYGAFYCMKYQTTQGQYVEFLNRLTYTQQDSCITGTGSPASPAGTYPRGVNRHAIYIDTPGVAFDTPAVYATDNPYVACSYLREKHGAAYAQWTGLRPMTELEYEKACRGPAEPVPNEYAWGTASLRGSRYTLSNAGAFNEVVNNQENSDTVGNALYASSSVLSPLGGPLRVGVFATSSTVSTNDRARAGASYWGIMELSGTLWDIPVSVDAGRQFEGSHGDGILSVAGYATRPDWPGYSGGEVTGVSGTRIRGGAYDEGNARLYVSNRANTVGSTARTTGNVYGWRGVRSAP